MRAALIINKKRKNMKNPFTKTREPKVMLDAKQTQKNFYLSSYIHSIGEANWSRRDYRKFADEGYIKNVVAHQCIKMLAVSAASVRIKLGFEDGVYDLLQHPLGRLLTFPNPVCGETEFLESMFSYQLISGNAYVLALAPQDSAPVELHLLRPDRMSVVAGRDGLPRGYRYKISDQKSKDYSAAEVLHLKFFHPLDDWYGLSPIEAAAYSIDQHNQAGAWNQALLQNGARPSGALVVKGGDGNPTTLSEDQYHRLKSQIDEQFSGADNSGRPLLLEGGLEWREMSLKPKDMDFMEMKHSSARDIALAFGVPPQLLGIPGDNTYSNMVEARVAFWEQTVIPLVDRFLDALNLWLVPKYGQNLRLFADLETVPALAPRREAMWERVKNADFLSDAEKRKLTGVEEELK